MQSRFVVPLLCAAAIVFACGPRFRATTRPTVSSARTVGVGTTSAHRRRGDTTAVDAAFAIDTAEGRVRLALDVTNVTRKRLEIDFPNGQTRDFAIYDEAGVQVWRWSAGRLFTQTVQNKFLASGDTARYEAQWRAPRAGRYSAVAVLRSRNYPVERTVTFTVAPAGVHVAVVADTTR